MHLFSDDTRRDRATLAKARQHLAEVSDRDGYPSEDYLDANDAVIDAEKPLRWWQRLDIDLELYRPTDDNRDTDPAHTDTAAPDRGDTDEF
ncbi:hypothetical protein [Actinoplanes sp. NPDC049681]|uniref:hypothetical protein n=1 Tax=Actinoplanes sp. NPDC049681 TaxID=3363905 RepID=UPI003790D1FA